MHTSVWCCGRGDHVAEAEGKNRRDRGKKGRDGGKKEVIREKKDVIGKKKTRERKSEK